MTGLRVAPPDNAAGSPSLRSRVLRNGLRYSPASVVPSIFNLLSTVVFVRLLDAAAFGVYALAVAAMVTGTAVTTQWVVQGMNRYLPGADAAAAAPLKKAAASMAALVGLAMAGVTCLAALFLAGLGYGDWTPVFWPVAAYLAVNSVWAAVGAILQAQLQATGFSVFRSVEALLRFALALAFFAVVPAPASLLWGAPVAVALLLPFIWRKAVMPVFDHGRGYSGFLPDARRIAVYGVPMSGWFLAAALLEVGDRYILQWFHGAETVGLYAANYAIIAGGAGVLCAPILLSAHPLLMRTWNAGGADAAGKLIADVTQALLAATVVGVVLLLFVSPLLSRLLLGEAYAAGHVIMPVVFAAQMLWQVSAYTHKPIEFANRSRLLMGLALGAAALNLALNLLLIPRFGFLAAAWTTATSYAAYLVTTVVIGRRSLRWPLLPQWR